MRTFEIRRIEICLCLFSNNTFPPLSVLDVRLGDRYLCDHLDMNGFSEEELLNITFEACDAAGRGRLPSLSLKTDETLLETDF